MQIALLLESIGTDNYGTLPKRGKGNIWHYQLIDAGVSGIGYYKFRLELLR
jgi:hypothetical protein